MNSARRRAEIVCCVGWPSLSSSQCCVGHEYGEFRMGWSKNGLDIGGVGRESLHKYDCCYQSGLPEEVVTDLDNSDELKALSTRPREPNGKRMPAKS